MVKFDDDEVFVDNTQQEINEEPTQKRKRVGKTRSDCWKSFEKIFIDGVRHGKCKWCERALKADGNNTGTSSLNKHAKNCKKNPENLKNQQTLQFKKEPTGEGSVSIWKHDDKRIKKAMLNLFVVGGLPFKFVENEAFYEYTNALNGKVIVPCRTTISKKVSLYYQEERNKLVTFLCNPLNTIHLTTDCWTSPSKRVHYIVITAHFIDDNWEMHKRIINFKELDSQRGEDIGKEVLKCIQGWGIKNVMTCTVDNASSNDKAIEFLKNKLPNLYNEGKHFHIRCMAHIINLIVRDGMNKNDESVKCLQDAVRYIRKSTQRIALFKKCMKAVGVESTKFLCNDCPTRWNSTYDLLKIAVDLEKAFYEYEMEDVVTPVSEDFVTCRAMVSFLEKFKVKTELVSTTSKPLANRFFGEVCGIYKHIRVWSKNKRFYSIGKDMIDKYEKYWGDFENLNDYIHAFETLIKYKMPENKPLSELDITAKTKSLIKDIESRFENFFNCYNTNSNVPFETGGSQDTVHIDDDDDFVGDYFAQSVNSSASKETELTRYLNKGQTQGVKDFDILVWWKNNASRYPILSRMAKDLLGIQISTVASESAFSTSGRIIDSYRANLSAPIIEALVCTQDWVRKSKKPIVDNIDDILKDDDIAKELEDAIRTQNGNGKRPIDINE
uniref:BED-type domain-containing protein n=1 Tax=Lactuca sativa TaxID=4236 RepID=A0A9R1V2N0_LACSA|nr:hypothetical protein LSAT_V11C700355780 [Lactuca sativa]